jgi:hypothetical protein
VNVAAVRQVGAILVVFMLGGAVAGALWETWWTPPTGIVMSHSFLLDEQGVSKEFSGTGLYVAVAVAAGCLLGALVALVFRERDLLTLGAAVGAALAGGWVMAWVGQAMGPADPKVLAKDLVDLSPLVSDLSVHGLSPYLAMPMGALIGVGIAMLADVGIRRFRRSPEPAPVQ